MISYICWNETIHARLHRVQLIVTLFFVEESRYVSRLVGCLCFFQWGISSLIPYSDSNCRVLLEDAFVHYTVRLIGSPSKNGLAFLQSRCHFFSKE